jgi:hypothetical protein
VKNREDKGIDTTLLRSFGGKKIERKKGKRKRGENREKHGRTERRELKKNNRRGTKEK